MKKRMTEKILLAILIAGTLFLTGCTAPQPTDDTFYAVGKILHNVDSSTPTSIDFEREDYGQYDFDYGFGGDGPNYYMSYMYFTAPWQDMAAGANIIALAPFTQTFYAIGQADYPAGYLNNFSLDRSVYLNYLGGKELDSYSNEAFDFSQGEYISENAFNSINPTPGEHGTFTFGHSYLPGSITNNNGEVKMRNYPLGGWTSFVSKYREASICPVGSDCRTYFTYEKPHYSIYFNDVLRTEGDFGKWSGSDFSYYFSGSDDGYYSVNISTVSYYPTFNHTNVVAKFRGTGADTDPPWLTSLEVEPRFSQGGAIALRLTANDDKSNPSVRVFYRVGSDDWTPVTLSLIQGKYSPVAWGSFTPALGSKAVDLKIVLMDGSKNSQAYYISPVSLEEKELQVVVNRDREVLSPGSKVKFDGFVSDDDGGVSSLLVSVLYNGKEIDKSYTSKYSYIDSDFDQVYETYVEGGDFIVDLEIPASYKEDDNISFVFGGTGRYPVKEEVISGFAQVFESDSAVTRIQAPEPIYVGAISVNATIANVGKVPSAGVLSIYSFTGCDNYYPADCCEGSYFGCLANGQGSSVLLASKPVSLEVGEERTENFDFILPGEAVSFAGQEMRIVALLEDSEDSYMDNNYRDVARQAYAEYDARAGSDVPSSAIVNETSVIVITATNSGLKKLYNVNYTAEYAEAIYDDPKTEEIEEMQFVKFAEGSIDSISVGKTENRNVNLVINRTGDYAVRVRVNASNDRINHNDYYDNYINIQSRGSSLRLWFSDLRPFIVGESTPFNVTIYNFGNERSVDGNVSFYYQNGYCEMDEYSSYGCDNLTLVDSREVNLDRYEFATETFEFSAAEEGGYTFVLVLNASNEIKLSDNVVSIYVRGVLEGPDVWAYTIYSSLNNIFAGRESNVTAGLGNMGTESAIDVNVSLSLVDGCKEEEGRTLLGNIILPEIVPGDYPEVNISFTAGEKGDICLVLNASLEGDVDLYNNYGFDSTFVKSDGPDGAVDGMYPSLIAGQESRVHVWLRNVGRGGIFGANLSLLIDNEVVASNLVDINDNDYTTEIFSIVPEQAGIVNASVVLKVDGDVDESDNSASQESLVRSLKKVRLTIADSDDNNVTRALEFPGGFVITNNKTFEFETIDGAEYFTLYAISFNDSYSNFEESISAYAGLRMGGMSMLEEESIITEQHDSIIDNSTEYYYVFANRPSFTVGDYEFFVYLGEEYFNKLGMDSEILQDYALFRCGQFDFDSRTCTTGWIEDENSYAQISGADIGFTGRGEEAFEAFAIAESSGLSSTSTDVTMISGSSAQNPVFEKRAYGGIAVQGMLDIANMKANPNLADEAIKIRSGMISIDTDLLPQFENMLAQLTFKGIDMRNPRVVYNNAMCPSNICTWMYYNSSSKVLIVNVTGFSEFGVVEGEFCGDGICQSGESCTSCTADCSCAPLSSSGRGGGGGGGGSGIVECVPAWNCTWGPCVGSMQRWVCKKANDCYLNLGKPAERTQICFVEQQCVDNDRDGYGAGVDCLGIDLNDNDPGVTDVLLVQQQVQDEKAKSSYFTLAVILIILLAMGLAVIGWLIVEISRSMKSYGEAKAEKEQMMLMDAKDFAVKCRARGYSDEEIAGMLNEHSWNEEEISSILRS